MNEVKDMTANIHQGELTFFANLSRGVQCW